MKKTLALLVILGIFFMPAFVMAHDSYSCRYVKGKRDCDWNWHWHITIDSRSFDRPASDQPCYEDIFVEGQWVRTSYGYKWVGPHLEKIPCRR